MIRKRLCVCLLVASMIFGFALPASADQVKIKGKNFVADRFCGVPAYYNENATVRNAKWQCYEFVVRFYREAYGISIANRGGPVSLTSGYQMKKTKSPKPGDIFHSPAKRRGRPTDHWAIVKSYSGGYVTLVEQNHHYDNKASVNRQVAISNKAVDIYTPVGVGKADPKLKGFKGAAAAEEAPEEKEKEDGVNAAGSLDDAEDKTTAQTEPPTMEKTTEKTTESTTAPATEAPTTVAATEKTTEPVTEPATATTTAYLTDPLAVEMASAEVYETKLAATTAAEVIPDETSPAAAKPNEANPTQAAPTSTQVAQTVTAIAAAELLSPAEAVRSSRKAPVMLFVGILYMALGLCAAFLLKNEKFRRKLGLFSR